MQRSRDKSGPDGPGYRVRRKEHCVVSGDGRQSAGELSRDSIPRQYPKYRGGDAGRIGDAEEGRIEVRGAEHVLEIRRAAVGGDLAKISVIRHDKSSRRDVDRCIEGKV